MQCASSVHVLSWKPTVHLDWVPCIRIVCPRLLGILLQEERVDRTYFMNYHDKTNNK